MTAINPATDIPSNINTVEKLLLWANALLSDLYRGQTFKESTGDGIDSGLAPLSDDSLVTAADGTKRYIGRSAIQVDDAYTTGTAKLWEYALPHGNAQIPAAYKTN